MTRRRRTKWHRRGGAAADALVGFFTVLVLAFIQLLASLVGLLIRMVSRPSKKVETGTKRSVSVRGRVGAEASRRQRLFDPAAVPTVRFDSVADARRQIIERRLVDRPVADDVRIDEIISQTNGFSGADVANLIETAARRAFLSSLQSTTENCSISHGDLMEALADTQPSVSATELRRYREWQQKLSAPQSV